MVALVMPISFVALDSLEGSTFSKWPPFSSKNARFGTLRVIFSKKGQTIFYGSGVYEGR